MSYPSSPFSIRHYDRGRTVGSHDPVVQNDSMMKFKMRLGELESLFQNPIVPSNQMVHVLLFAEGNSAKGLISLRDCHQFLWDSEVEDMTVACVEVGQVDSCQMLIPELVSIGQPL